MGKTKLRDQDSKDEHENASYSGHRSDDDIKSKPVSLSRFTPKTGNSPLPPELSLHVDLSSVIQVNSGDSVNNNSQDSFSLPVKEKNQMFENQR